MSEPVPVVTNRYRNNLADNLALPNQPLIRHSHREKLLAALALFLLAAFSASIAIKQLRSSTLSRSRLDCQFPAVFNFGDSNSDTGTVSAAFKRLQPPFGRTFFGKPSGRYSDGRLVIDFIAEKLGLPYLNAYLDSVGTNYLHGANFAASGSTIKPNPTMNPINLKIQLSQFEQFRERMEELLLDQVKSKVAYAKSSLPRPDDFSKALYIVDSGQNDIHGAITSMTEDQVRTFIPTVIDEFASAVEELHKLGAKSFWIHNTGPIGCLPFFLKNYPPNPSDLDKNGCIKSYNEVSQGFNKQLKDKIHQLRTKLSDALLIYVDIYSAKYALITEAKEYGFENPLGYCCGQNGNYSFECGESLVVNGTEVRGASCSNPAEYISWDSIHYTEAANQWVASRILDGSLSDPQVPITLACQRYAHSQ